MDTSQQFIFSPDKAWYALHTALDAGERFALNAMSALGGYTALALALSAFVLMAVVTPPPNLRFISWFALTLTQWALTVPLGYILAVIILNGLASGF